MIRVVAKFSMKPEKKDEAMPLFEELIKLTRQEDGCNGYDLAKSTADDNLLVVLESWRDKEALDKHSASEHFTRIVPQLVGMCIDNPSIDSFIQVI